MQETCTRNCPKAHDRRPKFSVQQTRTRNSHDKLGRNRAVTNSEQVSRTRKKLVRERMTYERSFSCEFLVRVSWTENVGRLSWALIRNLHKKNLAASHYDRHASFTYKLTCTSFLYVCRRHYYELGTLVKSGRGFKTVELERIMQCAYFQDFLKVGADCWSWLWTDIVLQCIVV